MRNDEAVLNKSGGLCAGTAHDVQTWYQHDVGDPECEYKLGMAKQTLHPDVKHLGDINKVSSLIVNDNFCVVRVAGVSDEGGANGILHLCD